MTDPTRGKPATTKQTHTAASQKNTAPLKKPGIRWTAVVFAFAGNLLFITVANAAAGLALGSEAALLWASILGPALAGMLTAIVAQQRGGIHALLGSAASIPVIALFLLPGAWRTAIFAACFCTLGAAIAEILMRQRARPTP